MLENATRLCEAKFGMHVAAATAMAFELSPSAVTLPAAYAEQFGKQSRLSVPRPSVPLGTHGCDQASRSRSLTCATSKHTSKVIRCRSPASNVAGARTLVAVPMLKENDLVGAIAIYRQEVRRSPTSRSSW